jgi:Berberine and berberine like
VAGSFLNFLPDTARTASAYTASDYERLTTVKAAYDPDDVFRLNHRPRAAAAPAQAALAA